MTDLLASIIDDALAQAGELPELDAVRAEVWASDLVALAMEAGPDGPARVIDALVAAGGPGPAAALRAIDAIADGVELGDPALEPAPSWVGDLLTSTCEAAWLVSDWRGASAAFRFVDAADERHVVLVDLVPDRGAAETAGEATVGPSALLDSVADEDTKLRSEPVPATDLLLGSPPPFVRRQSRRHHWSPWVGCLPPDSRHSGLRPSSLPCGSKPTCPPSPNATPTTMPGQPPWFAEP